MMQWTQHKLILKYRVSLIILIALSISLPLQWVNNQEENSIVLFAYISQPSQQFNWAIFPAKHSPNWIRARLTVVFWVFNFIKMKCLHHQFCIPIPISNLLPNFKLVLAWISRLWSAARQTYIPSSIVLNPGMYNTALLRPNCNWVFSC